MVTRRPPDGYNMTLLTAGYASGAAVGKFPFDGDNTFGFITMVCSYPFVYSVPKDSPIKSFPGHAGARQGRSRQAQLCDHLARRGLSSDRKLGWHEGRRRHDAGVLSRLAAAVTDVMAGRVDVCWSPRPPAFPRIRTGQFRALAVTSPERYPLMPDAPTVAETLPGVQLHVLARHGDRAAHAAADRRSPERGNPSRARIPDVKQKLKEGGNIAARPRPRRCAGRSRTRSPTGRDRRSQPHQGQLTHRDRGLHVSSVIWKSRFNDKSQGGKCDGHHTSRRVEDRLGRHAGARLSFKPAHRTTTRTNRSR